MPAATGAPDAADEPEALELDTAADELAGADELAAAADVDELVDDAVVLLPELQLASTRQANPRAASIEPTLRKRPGKGRLMRCLQEFR
ncbi:MAG: hypothetical protein ABJD68_02250 [Nakamurella sp.]